MAKILIIEDDAAIAAIEKDYLELSGCEVCICADGVSGLTAAWLYRSAVNAGMNKSLWMILGLVGNLLAVAAFFIVRDAPQRLKKAA